MMYWLALTLGIVATIVFLVVRVKYAGIPGVITKAAASVLFIATACAAIYTNPDAMGYGFLIVIGLACGLLGDIWLDLKWIYLEDMEKYLYAGFYSFFVGHLFFISAIFLHYNWTFTHILAALALSTVGAAFTIALEKLLKLDYGKFKLTCFIYGFILFMTTFSSVVASFATGETIWIVMSIGSVLFLLSDLVLSGMYFGDESKNNPVNVVINHSLYYSAQFVIASSILFLK